MSVAVRPVSSALSGDALSAAARALLTSTLRREGIVLTHSVQKTALGQPYLPGDGMPHISLAHTQGLVCCAVSSFPIGVDAEPLDRFINRPLRESVVSRVCTAREAEEIFSRANPGESFLKYWVLKESISKALGKGFTEGFQRYELFENNGAFVCPGFSLFLWRAGAYLVGAARRA